MNNGVKSVLIELDFKDAQTAAREARDATKRETAVKLLNKGLSIEDIADATDLDIGTIKELKEQYLKNATEGQ